MRKAAVTLARTIGYVEAADLNARGDLFPPEMAEEIAKKYSFKKCPKDIADFNPRSETGIEFLSGRSGKRVISKFAIWSNLSVVETNSSTEDSKELLEEILLWASQNIGLTYVPGMIKRFAYISSLTFYSDVALLNISPAVERLAAKASEALTAIWQEPVRYEPLFLSVGHDPASRKSAIAPFQITRRADARFADNKYFSEAPLPTSLHLEMLEQFESTIKLERMNMTDVRQ